jgi:hypothetical protein
MFSNINKRRRKQIEIFLLQLINELSKDKLPFPMLMRSQIRVSQTLEDDECKLKKNLIFRIEMNKFRSIKSEIIFRNDWIENSSIIEWFLSQEKQLTFLAKVAIRILIVSILAEVWRDFFNILFDKECKKKLHANGYSTIFGDHCRQKIGSQRGS